MAKINFAPFNQEEHIELLKNWLQGEHVQGFWQELVKAEELASEFLSQLQKRGVRSFIADFKGKAMGYIQFYEVSQKSESWGDQKPEEVYEIEILIGESIYLGQGLASQMISQFIDFMRDEVDLSNLIIDSRSSNAKALKAFKEVGFKEVMKMNLNNHETMLLKLSQ